MPRVRIYHYLFHPLDKKALMQIPYKQTNRYKNEHGTRKITRKHRRFAARHRHIRTIPRHRWLNPHDDRTVELSGLLQRKRHLRQRIIWHYLRHNRSCSRRIFNNRCSFRRILPRIRIWTRRRHHRKPRRVLRRHTDRPDRRLHLLHTDGCVP